MEGGWREEEEAREERSNGRVGWKDDSIAGGRGKERRGGARRKEDKKRIQM